MTSIPYIFPLAGIKNLQESRPPTRQRRSLRLRSSIAMALSLATFDASACCEDDDVSNYLSGLPALMRVSDQPHTPPLTLPKFRSKKYSHYNRLYLVLDKLTNARSQERLDISIIRNMQPEMVRNDRDQHGRVATAIFFSDGFWESDDVQLITLGYTFRKGLFGIKRDLEKARCYFEFAKENLPEGLAKRIAEKQLESIDKHHGNFSVRDYLAQKGVEGIQWGIQWLWSHKKAAILALLGV